MSHFTDESGMFADFNFKLVVIDSILDQSPSFESELAEMKRRYLEPVDHFCYLEEPVPEMVSYFQKLRLTEEDLDKVLELEFDGGNCIYFLLKPDWDGEEDIFDVTSVQGWERLKNLYSVFWSSMCTPDVLAPFRDRGIEMNI